jgi:hypothetical protein
MELSEVLIEMILASEAIIGFPCAVGHGAVYQMLDFVVYRHLVTGEVCRPAEVAGTAGENTDVSVSRPEGQDSVSEAAASILDSCRELAHLSDGVLLGFEDLLVGVAGE